MNKFGIIILNMWYFMGKLAGILFDQFISISLQFGQFIYDLELPVDVVVFIGLMFMILLLYIVLLDYQANTNIRNKNMQIEMNDMLSIIEFYEAKHKSYDIIVEQLHKNMNKMKRNLQKLEKEMKKYD